MRSSVFLVLAAALAGCAQAADRTPIIDTSEIIRRSIAANEADWRAHAEYSYLETAYEDGKPAKTYQALMIEGSRYLRLWAVDGKPLPPGKAQEELEKLRETIRKRESESASDREKRIAKYQEQRAQEYLMFQQMTRAFQFGYAGVERINGREAYVFDAQPRAGYVPPNQKAKVLTGMRGKLWVDKATFHWAKVEAEVVEPVAFSGVLARVDPGTRFTVENRPVSANVWMPYRFSMNVQAKILGMFGHKAAETSSFTDYRPNRMTLASLLR